MTLSFSRIFLCALKKSIGQNRTPMTQNNPKKKKKKKKKKSIV